MASPTELIGSLEPGTIPYGNRQGLEQALGQVGAQPGNLPLPTGPQGPPQSPDGLPVPPNPLDALMDGTVNPSGELSNFNTPQEPDMPDDLIDSLRAIALYAQSPVMREIARRSLRSQVRGTHALG